MRHAFIGAHRLGEGCFVIAEAGVNHNGSLEQALKLVDVAVAAGADAVKFQTFKPESLASPQAEKAAYQKEITGTHENQLEMLTKLSLNYEAFTTIKRHCDSSGIIFLSTPFDFESADFLQSLGVGAFKIPSGELNNLPFLAHIGAKQKPVILSTGMGSLEEVKEAVDTIERTGCPGMAILHCVSNYPAAAQDANLLAMRTLERFGHPVGYSDHTLGLDVAIASVALGAAVLEKHFTLDKTMEGPDHRCSLEPGELKSLVAAIHNIRAALGSGRKEPMESEKSMAIAARRSLFLRRPVTAGQTLTAADLEALRPGDGISPAKFHDIVGRKVRRDLPAHHKLMLEDLA